MEVSVVQQYKADNISLKAIQNVLLEVMVTDQAPVVAKLIICIMLRLKTHQSKFTTTVLGGLIFNHCIKSFYVRADCDL